MKLPKRVRKYDNGGYLQVAGGVAADVYSYKNADEFSDNTAKGRLVGGGIGGVVGGVAGYFVGNPVLGAQLGYAVGAGIGGKVGSKQDEKDIDARDTEMKSDLLTTAATQNYAANAPRTNPGLGFYRYGGKMRYAKGGMIPQYEVEQGEVVKLESGNKIASDMTSVTGATHENGGVDGTGGEFVFSDSITVSDNIKPFISRFNNNTSRKQTYADIATRLGKLKGKFENKLEDGSPRAVKTAEKMIGDIDGTLALLAEGQEMQKMETSTPKPSFKRGGRIYATGGSIEPIQRRQHVVTGTNPVPLEYAPEYDMYEDDVTTRQALRARGNIFGERAGEFSEQAENDPYLQADIANLTNYGLNLAAINNVKQYPKPNLVPVQQASFYRDRRAASSINNTYATMMRKGINPALASTLYGSTIRAVGDAEAQQSILENSVRNKNVDTLNNTNALNTQITNTYQRDLIDTKNQQLLDKINARNAATSAYMENRYAKRRDDAELDRILMDIESDPTRSGSRYMDRVKGNPALSSYNRYRFQRYGR
jgi:hypothetical protein